MIICKTYIGQALDMRNNNVMLNKNTQGVKKCEAKKNQRLKALVWNLISIKNFYFTGQDVFPTMIGFVTLSYLSYSYLGMMQKR